MQSASSPRPEHVFRSAVARGLRAAAGLAFLLAAGCTVFDRPSNNRDWSPDQAVLPYAEVTDDRVAVHNIRNCTYLSADSYVLNYYDRTYDLRDVESVDYILVPFRGMPSVAHTMLSFGLTNGEHLCVSVEIRREKGEAYQFFNGILNKYEIMYVLGDERDLVKLRTNYRKDDVYVYRLRATPDQARAMFVDVMTRVDSLAAQPEFYNTFTNNCTTNAFDHINHCASGKVPYSMGVLLPGYSDRVIYRAGLLDTDQPFEEARRRALVSEKAVQFAESPDFSQAIRR